MSIFKTVKDMFENVVLMIGIGCIARFILMPNLMRFGKLEDSLKFLLLGLTLSCLFLARQSLTYFIEDCRMLRKKQEKK